MSTTSSDHWDGRRFFNPTGPAAQPFSAVPRMLMEPRTRWPARVDDPPQQPAPLDGSAAVVTFIGHATFLIQTAAGNILTDPMYSDRAGTAQPAPGRGGCGSRRCGSTTCRRSSTGVTQPQSLRPLRSATLRKLATRFDPLVVTPLGNGALVRSAGIRQVEELDWWQEARTSRAAGDADAGASFLGADAVRSQPRAVGRLRGRGRRRQRIYFAGDTRIRAVLQRGAQRLGPIDLALLPIGAYEPRWFMRRRSHEPGGGGPGTPRSRVPAKHRDALRHLPADHRRD